MSSVEPLQTAAPAASRPAQSVDADPAGAGNDSDAFARLLAGAQDAGAAGGESNAPAVTTATVQGDDGAEAPAAAPADPRPLEDLRALMAALLRPAAAPAAVAPAPVATIPTATGDGSGAVADDTAGASAAATSLAVGPSTASAPLSESLPEPLAGEAQPALPDLAASADTPTLAVIATNPSPPTAVVGQAARPIRSGSGAAVVPLAGAVPLPTAPAGSEMQTGEEGVTEPADVAATDAAPAAVPLPGAAAGAVAATSGPAAGLVAAALAPAVPAPSSRTAGARLPAPAVASLPGRSAAAAGTVQSEAPPAGMAADTEEGAETFATALRGAAGLAPAAEQAPAHGAAASTPAPASTELAPAALRESVPAASVPAAGVSPAPVLATASPHAWAPALGEHLLRLVASGEQQAEIRVNPPHLGPIEVRLAVQQDSASVTFLAHDAGVRDALEASLPRLRELLGGQGVQLGQASVGDHPNARQSPAYTGADGQGQGQGSGPWRPRGFAAGLALAADEGAVPVRSLLGGIDHYV